MNKNKCKLVHWCSYFFVVIFFVSGCASPQLWYKPDHNQVDFDIDDKECRIVAEEIGRQATITGEKVSLEVFTRSYSNCIFSRGWSHTPPDAEQKTLQPVELAQVDGKKILVFDKQLTLPPGFNLASNQISAFQDVRLQTLFFQGTGPVYLNIIIQETLLPRKFDRIEYPANDPFFVYENGYRIQDKSSVDWTVFSGDFKGEWVAGIGAYYLVDQSKRISLVMTKSIGSPKQPPPAGLRLTKNQKIEVEHFSDQWLDAIKQAFSTGDNPSP